MENFDSSANSNNFEDSQNESPSPESNIKFHQDDQIPHIVVLPASNQTKKHHKSYIEEVLD